MPSLIDELYQEESSNPYMTVQEAAKFLCVTPHTVYEYLKFGTLTRYQVGDYKRTLVSRAEVEGLVRPVGRTPE